MDKTQIVVSTLAGLATIAVGYLVWKHESTVDAANAQANLDAQQAANDAANEQLMNEMAALPTGGSYAGGNYGTSTGTGADSSTGANASSALATPASSSNDLQAILNAFYPTTTYTPAGVVSTAPSNMLANATTGTAASAYGLGSNYSLVLPTTLPSYTPPAAPSIYPLFTGK